MVRESSRKRQTDQLKPNGGNKDENGIRISEKEYVKSMETIKMKVWINGVTLFCKVIVRIICFHMSIDKQNKGVKGTYWRCWPWTALAKCCTCMLSCWSWFDMVLTKFWLVLERCSKVAVLWLMVSPNSCRLCKYAYSASITSLFVLAGASTLPP